MDNRKGRAIRGVVSVTLNRRAFLGGLISAPAVIRLAPLMAIVPFTMRVNLDRFADWWDADSHVVLESASFEVPIMRTGRIMSGFTSMLRPDLKVGSRPEWAPISPIKMPAEYRGRGFVMSYSTGPNLGPGRDYMSGDWMARD